jgi:hypothetical protein
MTFFIPDWARTAFSPFSICRPRNHRSAPLHDNAEKKHSPAGRTAQDSWPIYAVAASLLIALGALAWWADNRLVDQAQKEIGRELNAVLSTTTRALDHWFQNFEEVLRIWGSDDVTLELSQALLDLGGEFEVLRATPLQLQISDHLRPVLALPGVRGYSIYSTDGTVLSGSRSSDLGRKSSSTELQDLMKRALQSNSGALISLPLRGQGRDFATMIGAFAVRDKSGSPVAILTLRIDPESQFTEILQRRWCRTWGYPFSPLTFVTPAATCSRGTDPRCSAKNNH